MSDSAIRVETKNGVRHLILCRAEQYNTITPQLRDELSAAIDAAVADSEARVILLRGEGPAFCAGYNLDWSTGLQDGEERRTRVWDSVTDYRAMSRFVTVYMKLWYASKPTIAAVQGWCVGGGTDMVLCADIIIAAENASFGYPPSRVWGTPTTAMWVYRMGLERAKRYLLTGDEIPAVEAARIGLILETVPDQQLLEHATAFAERMARADQSAADAEDALQSHRREHGSFDLAHLGHALRRHRAAHAGRTRLRRARAGKGLPAGGPGTRRSFWGLRIGAAIEEAEEDLTPAPSPKVEEESERRV